MINPENLKTGYFLTQDGLKLFYRIYPATTPKGWLVILHGHGEHSGRYEKFAHYLKSLNLNIAAFDFRGTGRSEGPEVYVESFEKYLQDVTTFLDFLKTQYACTEKVILLGHSLGGLTAVHWAMRHPEKLRALILSSPCLGLLLPNFLVSMNHWFNTFIPKMRYQNPVYPPHLTHNPEEVKAYKEDKLIKRKISVRLLNEMILYSSRIKTLDTLELPFPFYVIMSGMEKVVDAEKTKVFFEKVVAPQKAIKIFPKFYHEVFNELGQEKAFEVLNDYLRQILLNV